MDKGTAKTLMLLPTDDTPDPTILREFQALVGDLIWLLRTRIDMYFTINILCRFLQSATKQHLDIARNRPLRYLRGTMDHGLVFAATTGKWTLSGASDAALADDIKSTRTTMGHYLKLGDYGAIAAHCGLERKICTSTGQAETYAMQGLVKDTVWVRGMLAELGFPMDEPTRLRTDNDGVFKQSTNHMNHGTAKHYRIAQAYVRNNVRDKTCIVDQETTDKNEADMLTKPNFGPDLRRHAAKIMGPQSTTRLAPSRGSL